MGRQNDENKDENNQEFASGTYHKFAVGSKKRCSILEIICGAILIGIQVPIVALRSELHFIATGFWTGIIFILSGVFGIKEGRKRTNKYAKCSSGFCAFSAVIALSGLLISIIDFWFEYQFMQCEIGVYEQDPICSTKRFRPDWPIENEILVYLLGLMVCLMLIELLCCIIHSVLGCLGILKIQTTPTKYVKNEPKVVYIELPESQYVQYKNGTLSKDVLENYKNSLPRRDNQRRRKISSSHDQENGKVHILRQDSAEDQWGIENLGLEEVDVIEKQKRGQMRTSTPLDPTRLAETRTKRRTNSTNRESRPPIHIQETIKRNDSKRHRRDDPDMTSKRHRDDPDTTYRKRPKTNSHHEPDVLSRKTTGSGSHHDPDVMSRKTTGSGSHHDPDVMSRKTNSSGPHRHDPERQSRRSRRSRSSRNSSLRRSHSNSSRSSSRYKHRDPRPDYTRPPPHHGLKRDKRYNIYQLKPFETNA